MLRREKATLFCPRRFSCLRSWPSLSRDPLETCPINSDPLVPLELSDRIPPCANAYIRLQGLRLAGPEASALSYINEAILRGPCAAPTGGCRSSREIAEAELSIPKPYEFTESDPPTTLKYLYPGIRRKEPKREDGGDLGKS